MLRVTHASVEVLLHPDPAIDSHMLKLNENGRCLKCVQQSSWSSIVYLHCGIVYAYSIPHTCLQALV